MSKKTVISGIPTRELDPLAKSILAIAQKLFENPEIQREYEQWLAERQSKQNLKKGA